MGRRILLSTLEERIATIIDSLLSSEEPAIRYKRRVHLLNEDPDTSTHRPSLLPTPSHDSSPLALHSLAAQERAFYTGSRNTWSCSPIGALASPDMEKG